MDHTPPVIRTVLDLTTEELVEVEAKHARLGALLALAERERPEETRTAAHAHDIMRDDIPLLPTSVSLVMQRLNQMVPHTLVSASMLGTASAMCDNAAKAVLWAHALAAFYARTGKPATLATVFRGHLDGWLPTDAGMRGLWEAQKVSRELQLDPSWTTGDNWLDHPAAWTPQALKAGAVERVPVADDSR